METPHDETVLSLYTVYERPRDFPASFVVRRHDIMRGRPEPVATSDFWVCETLDQARAVLPPGLTCLGRDPGDEPQIVETWI